MIQDGVNLDVVRSCLQGIQGTAMDHSSFSRAYYIMAMETDEARQDVEMEKLLQVENDDLRKWTMVAIEATDALKELDKNNGQAQKGSQ